MRNLKRFIEHTALKPTLTGKDIDQLVEEAIEYEFLGVCVPTFWVKKAARQIKKHGIQLVTVIGFPLGYQMTENKLDEINLAIDNGANELDIVMNISAFKSDMPWVKIELAKCAQLIHERNCLMKVIIETAYLSDEEIVKASLMCQDAGTDFVKTSTGFAPAGARIDHIKLIRATIHSNIGVKASGGIRDLDTALKMIDAGADRLGVSAGVEIMQEMQQRL
ncbi:MAG: deoxyribose-phosphate aldolase [Cyclobacteriaceae bacterium]|nr:deoxyribose-phosphate aldolase [Cyclobacteriaceae bacterium]